MTSPTGAIDQIDMSDVVSAGPVAQHIEALDVVRGVALFGILLMNITGFGLPQAYYNPMNAGGATGANLWAWIITQIGFEGTQRGLFSLLFGASVILLTSRLQVSGRKRRLGHLFYRFGPVEWLWRYLSYMKRPPKRYTAVPVTAGRWPLPDDAGPGYPRAA